MLSIENWKVFRMLSKATWPASPRCAGAITFSIKTSNEILNSKPEPPKAVKTTLYLSQAECYEELNQIDNAIKAYEKVQTIEPSSSSFFSTKIRQLNLKKVK